MASKGQRKTNGNFELSEAPSHLIRRCEQVFADLYASESGPKDLTRSQLTVLCALEHNEDVSQTALVEMTGVDRSTLAEMIRRLLDRGYITKRRPEADLRSYAVSITPAGRKALRSGRAASSRAERRMLEPIPQPERQRFIKYLASIASAGEETAGTTGAAAFKRKMRRLKA
ncbi:MAG TPA: MarR family transcriptional regulator [Rhizomicrobium sp.]|jgi:DNA-binding MarR family transcriptional regulator